MLAVVQRQGGDPVAGLQSERLQRLGHPPRIMGNAAPVGPGDGAIGPGRHNLPSAMLALGMVHQPHHPKRPILHRPKSQFATPSSRRRYSLTAERPADKRLANRLGSDPDWRNRDS